MDINSFEIPNLVPYSDNIDFNKPNWQTQFNTYFTDVNTYFMLACNRFKWESKDLIPEDRYSHLIEYYLATCGQAFIEIASKKVYQGVASEAIDEFGRPTGFTIYGYNGDKNSPSKRNVKYNEVIWIKNNPLRIPTLYWIRKYCKRINEVEKTMDLNLQALKTPYIIETDNAMRYSMQLFFDSIDDYKKRVIVDKENSIKDNITILKLDAPYLVRDLQDHKYEEENQLLQLLGIDTINEKNAHMLYAEVQNSNEITDNYTDIFTSERKLAVIAAEKANIDLHLSKLDISPDMGDMNGEEVVNNVENTANITEIA